MEIPQWIMNSYSDIEQSDIVLQEELIGISTNEELKKWLPAILASERHTCYLSCFMEYRKTFFASFSVIILRGKGFQHSINLFTKKKKKETD